MSRASAELASLPLSAPSSSALAREQLEATARSAPAARARCGAAARCPLALEVHDIAKVRSIAPLSIPRRLFLLCARGRRDDRVGRERAAADQRAALDEERQLARRHAHDLAVVAPELREAAALQPLLEDAEPGAVPEQHLAESRAR